MRAARWAWPPATFRSPHPASPVSHIPSASRTFHQSRLGGLMAEDELYERGIAIREEMLGPEHGRAKVESQPDFTRDFEELVTRYCFGSVWGREQLSRGTRSMLTIAMLVAQ